MISNMSTKNKRIHRGKNKKKSWRKTDIRDVEEYLDDVRHQERTGGLLESKKDDHLFFVDKSIDKKQKKISAIERRRLRKLEKPLKCYRHLQPDNNVPPPTIPNRTAQKPALFKSKRLAEKGPTKSELMAIKQRRKAVKELKKKKATYDANRVIKFDLWNDLKDEYEGEDPFYLEYTNKRRVKTPETYLKKPSEIPAVVVPHPGTSYNPSYEDHQELLHQAYKIELRRENKQKVLHDALDAMFPSAKDAPTQETWLSEMSAGLGISKDEKDDDDDEEEEDDEDKADKTEGSGGDDEEEDEKVSTQPKPKTMKQRRKAKELKIEERKRKVAKLERIRVNEVFKVRTLKKEIKKFDEDVQEKKEIKRKEWAERAKTRTKRLGKRYFQNAELELKLSEELPDCLRTLAPEGDALMDRFVSLQRRNVIEPRIPFRKKNQKKYKPKLYEKRSHKEIPQPGGTSK